VQECFSEENIWFEIERQNKKMTQSKTAVVSVLEGVTINLMQNQRLPIVI